MQFVDRYGTGFLLALVLFVSLQCPARGEPGAEDRSTERTTDGTPGGFVQQLIEKQGGARAVKRISFNRAPGRATDTDLPVVALCGALEELDLETLLSKRWIGGDGKWSSENRSIGAPEITDEGIAHIAALPRLRFITCAQSKVTDRSCRKLAESKSLETIGLDGTAITDSGFSELARIPTLKFVSVRGAAVTAEGVAKFRMMRPDVEILSNYRK